MQIHIHCSLGPSLSLSLSLPCTHGCSSGPWLQLWKRYDTNGRGALGTLSNTSSSRSGSNIELVEGGGGGSLDMGGACGSFGHRPRASLCPTPVTISNLWSGWGGVIERGEGEGARGLFDHRQRASLFPTPVATSNLGREVGEGYSITKRGIHDSSVTRNRNGDRNTNSSNHETGGGRSCHKTHLLPQHVHHHPAIPAIR